MRKKHGGISSYLCLLDSLGSRCWDGVRDATGLLNGTGKRQDWARGVIWLHCRPDQISASIMWNSEAKISCKSPVWDRSAWALCHQLTQLLAKCLLEKGLCWLESWGKTWRRLRIGGCQQPTFFTAWKWVFSWKGIWVVQFHVCHNDLEVGGLSPQIQKP